MNTLFWPLSPWSHKREARLALSPHGATASLLRPDTRREPETLGCDLSLCPAAKLILKDIGKHVLIFLQIERETQLGGCNLNFGRINVRLEMAEIATFC